MARKEVQVGRKKGRRRREKEREREREQWNNGTMDFIIIFTKIQVNTGFASSRQSQMGRRESLRMRVTSMIRS